MGIDLASSRLPARYRLPSRGDIDARLLLFPHPLVWLAFALTVLLIIVWAWLTGAAITGFGARLAMFPWLLLLMMIAAATIGGWRALLAVPGTFGILFLFPNAGQLLTYLGAASGFKPADAALAAIDRALGLDWTAYVAFFNDRPQLLGWLKKAYSSHMTALFATLLVLLATARVQRLREYVWLFFLCGAVTSMTGFLLPAVGAMAHHAPAPHIISNLPEGTGREFAATVLALTSGRMTGFDMSGLMGIVSIPSFHTVMALLVPWALRGTVFFIPGLAFGLLTLLATPIFGGHYFIDMIAGAALFATAIALLRRFGLKGEDTTAPIPPLRPHPLPAE